MAATFAPFESGGLATDWEAIDVSRACLDALTNPHGNQVHRGQ